MVAAVQVVEDRRAVAGRSARPSGLQSPRPSKDELCRLGDLGREGKWLCPSAFIDYGKLESLFFIVQKPVQNLDRAENGCRHIRSAEPLIKLLHLAIRLWVDVELYFDWLCHDKKHPPAL